MLRDPLPPVADQVAAAIALLRHLKADLSHVLDDPDCDRSRDQKVWKKVNEAYVALEEAERRLRHAETLWGEALPMLRQNLSPGRD